jgi:glycosyltransferase involved in cell wall biosynthesis
MKIYQYLEPLGQYGGGIETYVKSLMSVSNQRLNMTFIDSVVQIADSDEPRLLHIHQQHLLSKIACEYPVVYTAHCHDFYCPSGSKFLASTAQPCEKEMTTLGCLWGHLIDGCGSRRIPNIIKNFNSVHQNFDYLQSANVTVIAVSDYIRTQLIQRGLTPKKIFTVHNAIQIPQAIPQGIDPSVHRRKRILFVGRLVPYKGLDWVLKTLPQIDPEICLDVAGDGWDSERLHALACELGVENRITWHGWCSTEKLKMLYQQCFTLLFPSLWHEPAGLVMLEAYLNGRPVIASSTGGIPEYLLNGETGMLVSPGNVDELANAVTELANDYSKVKDMGEKARAYLLERFTLEQHLQGLQQVYASLGNTLPVSRLK